MGLLKIATKNPAANSDPSSKVQRLLSTLMAAIKILNKLYKNSAWITLIFLFV